MIADKHTVTLVNSRKVMLLFDTFRSEGFRRVRGWGMRAYIKIPLDEWEGEFCPLCVTYVLSACNVCQGAVDVLYSKCTFLLLKQDNKCFHNIACIFVIPL